MYLIQITVKTKFKWGIMDSKSELSKNKYLGIYVCLPHMYTDIQKKFSWRGGKIQITKGTLDKSTDKCKYELPIFMKLLLQLVNIIVKKKETYKIYNFLSEIYFELVIICLNISKRLDRRSLSCSLCFRTWIAKKKKKRYIQFRQRLVILNFIKMFIQGRMLAGCQSKCQNHEAIQLTHCYGKDTKIMQRYK